MFYHNKCILKSEDAQLQLSKLGGFSMKLKIGENIKYFRKSSNITQEELAEMLGVSCQSVSRWELGGSLR